MANIHGMEDANQGGNGRA